MTTLSYKPQYNSTAKKVLTFLERQPPHIDISSAVIRDELRMPDLVLLPFMASAITAGVVVRSVKLEGNRKISHWRISDDYRKNLSPSKTAKGPHTVWQPTVKRKTSQQLEVLIRALHQADTHLEKRTAEQALFVAIGITQ